MSDKCQHCTEVQVRLDMQMEIARLEAELEAMTTERNVAVANIGKRGRRVVELEAVEERLLKRVAELESELEANAWKISPAMAQAKIDQLNADLAAMRDRAAKAMHDYETAMMKLAKVEAELAKLQSAHEQCLIERNRLGVKAAGLQAIVDRLKAENQWHLAIKPPDDNRDVLTFGRYGIKIACHEFGTEDDSCWWSSSVAKADFKASVTHWRELPKPPKEAGK